MQPITSGITVCYWPLRSDRCVNRLKLRRVVVGYHVTGISWYQVVVCLIIIIFIVVVVGTISSVSADLL